MSDAKKLAAAARELAMECAAGTAPEFEGDSWDRCACGEMAVRAKLATRGRAAAGSAVRLLVGEGTHLVSAASDLPLEEQQDALVFPLLDLADQLDALP